MDLKRQNTNGQDIGGFKVFFQTMPKDIEALTKKEGLTEKEIKAEKPLPVPPQIKPLITEKEKLEEKLKAEEKARREEEERLKAEQRLKLLREQKIIAEEKTKREAEEKAEKEEKERLKIEKESLKIKIRTLYQEGKSLYKRRFYQEAIEKFEEISKLKPSWLVNWYLNRARKKFIKEQKVYSKEQKEIEERAKIEAEAKKEAEEKLKKEEEERKLAEEKARREEEKRLEAEQRLKLLREQKIIAEEKAKAEEKEKKIKELKPSFLFFRSLISQIKSFFSLQVVKIIGIILLILLIIIGLIYWLGAKEIKKPQPEPPPVTEIVLPNSLFIVDETEIITLKTGQEKKIFQELVNLSEKKQAVASFRRVLIKIVNQEQKYLSLEEFLKALDITFPPEILSSLENNYTLFFYSQRELPISPFLAGLGRNRLGLIINISKKNEILQQVSLWEKTMENDLEPLLLNKKMTLGLSQNQFQERYHHSSLIRYLDLPDRFVSLNYTFLNNKFILTTSQESINSLIEKIAP